MFLTQLYHLEDTSNPEMEERWVLNVWIITLKQKLLGKRVFKYLAKIAFYKEKGMLLIVFNERLKMTNF